MNFTKFLKSLFGDKSSRDMKLIQPFVEQVKAISPQIEKLDNDELRARTQEIRKHIQESATDKRKQIVFLTEKGRQLETVVVQARSEIMQRLARNETIAHTMHTMGPMLDTVIDYYVRHREE